MFVRWSEVIKMMTITAICSVLSAYVSADMLSVELTDEQRVLLFGQSTYQFPAKQVNFADEMDALPLFGFQITAETNLMRGHSLDLSASYQSWHIGPSLADFGTAYATEFSVKAPIQRYMDFTQSIKERAEISPEKLFDKFVIDGAVGFNFSW